LDLIIDTCHHKRTPLSRRIQWHQKRPSLGLKERLTRLHSVMSFLTLQHIYFTHQPFFSSFSGLWFSNNSLIQVWISKHYKNINNKKKKLTREILFSSSKFRSLEFLQIFIVRKMNIRQKHYDSLKYKFSHSQKKF
jgi:hypothetical protein